MSVQPAEGTRIRKAPETAEASGAVRDAREIVHSLLNQLGRRLSVMGEDACIVELNKIFLELVQAQSCGLCVPCRVGTKRMLEILNRICNGQGQLGDIEKLVELGEGIKSASACILGQTAPEPVLRTIKYFRTEYESHILNKRCLNEVGLPYSASCMNSCPAGVDIPGYIALIRAGRYAEAYEVVRRQNPLPSVCGRVCHHPCESSCRRALLDEPLAIRDLKRFAADYVFANGGPRKGDVPKTKGPVAIIGSGPAGLTAAYYLARKGYKVKIFEALPVAGGMLAVGIPAYRLPKDVLAKEIEAIMNEGVELELNKALGKDISIEELKRQGYKAIFIAIGAHRESKLNVPGEDLEGVIPGVVFLRRIGLGQPDQVAGKRVAVVGGGNVAMDVARSAMRLGAKEVRIIYRRRIEDMPAQTEEIEEAQKEGIIFDELVAPVEILGDGRAVKGLKCQRLMCGPFDESGRPKPVPIPGSEYVIPIDVIVPAIGQQVDGDVLAQNGLPVDKRQRVLTDGCATGVQGVFAGGDCVTGPATVIEAISAGRKAASAIDLYLGGDGDVSVDDGIRIPYSGNIVEEPRARVRRAVIPLPDREGNFKEVEMAFSETDARREALRCLRCDLKGNKCRGGDLTYGASYDR